MIFKKKKHYPTKSISLLVFLTPLVYKLGRSCYSAWKKHADLDPLRPKEEKRFGENKDRDLVDESIDESFPASDPPAHARLD